MKQKTRRKAEPIFSQAVLKQLVLPLLKTEGRQYIKFANVLARKAKAGEQINTITSDGVETTNKASATDYVVKNSTQARERYIMKESTFTGKYTLVKKRKGIYDEYKAIQYIFAIALTPALCSQLGFSKEAWFVASWGSEMIMKTHDFLACPDDFSEVYRIAKKEFFETYKLVELMDDFK